MRIDDEIEEFEELIWRSVCENRGKMVIVDEICAKPAVVEVNVPPNARSVACRSDSKDKRSCHKNAEAFVKSPTVVVPSSAVSAVTVRYVCENCEQKFASFDETAVHEKTCGQDPNNPPTKLHVQPAMDMHPLCRRGSYASAAAVTRPSSGAFGEATGPSSGAIGETATGERRNSGRGIKGEFHEWQHQQQENYSHLCAEMDAIGDLFEGWGIISPCRATLDSCLDFVTGSSLHEKSRPTLTADALLTRYVDPETPDSVFS